MLNKTMLNKTMLDKTVPEWHGCSTPLVGELQAAIGHREQAEQQAPVEVQSDTGHQTQQTDDEQGIPKDPGEHIEIHLQGRRPIHPCCYIIAAPHFGKENYMRLMLGLFRWLVGALLRPFSALMTRVKRRRTRGAPRWLLLPLEGRLSILG